MGRLTEKDKKYIRENPQLKNIELAEILHCDRKTIGRYKKTIGIAFSQLHDFSKYNDYIKENYYKKTAKDLAEEIGCSKEYVQKIWNTNNLKGKTNRTYYCDYNYFHSIDNEDKAYLIGLLASDGNLYKREGHEGQIQICLQKKDKEILEKILIVLNSNHPIKMTEKTATVTFVSDIMYNDLKQIGLEENKTWHLKIEKIINNIPKQYWSDFLRGYFDGDGCISGKDKPSNFHTSFSVPKNISESFLNIIEYCTHERFSFSEDNRSEKYNFPFGTIAAKNSTQKYLLLQLMYNQTNSILYLQRKKQKAQELIKIIEDNKTNRSENKIAVTKWGELLESLKW